MTFFNRIKLLIIVYILMTLMTATPSYADSGNGTITQAAAITLMGVVGGICLMLGVKHIIIGDTLKGLLGKATGGASDLVDKADAAITTHRTELQGTVNNCVTRAEIRIDKAIETVNKINDNLDKMNPVSQVNALGKKTANFFLGLAKKAADQRQSGMPGPECEGGNVRLETGLQKALAQYDRTGDAENALAQMSEQDFEMLASFTNVSPVTSDPGAADPGSAAAASSRALHSVLEPHLCGWDLCAQTLCELSHIFFLGFLALLVLCFLIRVFVYIFRFLKLKFLYMYKK